MDALVLPLVSENDSPEAAMHQMRLSREHHVVVGARDAHWLLTNEQVLTAWAQGRTDLRDLEALATPAAELGSLGPQIWSALLGEDVLSPAGRDLSYSGSLYLLDAQVWPIMDQVPTDYGVLPALGGTVLVITRHEEVKQNQIRTQELLCRCPHSSTTEPANPPAVQEGAPCAHGGGNYRCC